MKIWAFYNKFYRRNTGDFDFLNELCVKQPHNVLNLILISRLIQCVELIVRFISTLVCGTRHLVRTTTTLPSSLDEVNMSSTASDKLVKTMSAT